MDLFSEGQKLTLLFQKSSNIVEMSCEIDKIFDDRLDLVLPKYFMRYIECLKEGSSLTAKAFSRLGTIDFNTVIISSPLEETFTIELDYNAIKLTSGKDLPVIKAVEQLELLNENDFLKVKTFEISTEYIKFNTDKKLKLNTFFDGSLILPKDYGIINFKAEITEIDPIYDNEYTAKFVTITEKNIQILLYYMYIYSKDID